jgi:hypothetical protein
MEKRGNKRVKESRSVDETGSNLSDQHIKSMISQTSAVKSYNPTNIFKQWLVLMKKVRLYHYLNGKSKFCRHSEGTCFRHALNGFTSNFKKAYLLKICLAFLVALIRRKFYNFFTSCDTIRFSLFPALFSFIQRSLLCWLKDVRNKDDWINVVIASLVGSMTMHLDDDRGRRHKIATYTFARALHTFVSLLDIRQVSSKIQDSESFVFAFCNALVLYLYFYEIDILPKGSKGSFETLSCITPQMEAITSMWKKQGQWRYANKPLLSRR